MEDKVETIGTGTVIQHGKKNDRIFLMYLDNKDCPAVLQLLREIARENRYSKIYCKVPGWAAPFFFSDGYLTEAYIPQFYNSNEPLFFVSKFLNSDRLLSIENDRLIELGKLLGSKREAVRKINNLPLNSKVRKLDGDDVDHIAEVYRKVFQSYPFPIHNPGYIRDSMKKNVRYYGVKKKGKIVALASAEVDHNGANAELTDFAVLPDHRGRRLAQKLLGKMEKEMKLMGIHTLYTIARMDSPAMNRTIVNVDYNYAGTLIRNTHISGKIESMNVFYKHL